ncbi:uncharacterized protein O3C94_002875 [Discoglossus pictus]
MKAILLPLLAVCSLTSVFAVCPTCAGDEICNNTTDTCDCNKTMYTVGVNPPSPIIECVGGNLNLYILKCQLERNRYNSFDVHLNDPTCLGKYETVNNTAQVAFHEQLKTGSCGFSVNETDSLIIYSNTLHISAKVSNILSRNNVSMNFSCVFPRNITTNLNVTLKPKVGITQLTVPETNAVMTVVMAVYTDPEFTEIVTSDTVLTVEQTVYVSVLIPPLEAGAFSVKVLRLYASGTDNPSVPPVYLVTDGCPNPELDFNLVSVIKNGINNEARFTMNVFQISGYDIVNLFADVTVCEGNCTASCSSRSSKDSQGQNVATVSVDNLYAEPKIDSGAFDRFSMPWILSSLLMSLLFVKLFADLLIMKALLLLFIALCSLMSVSESCTVNSECAGDELCNSATSTCNCDLTKYTTQVSPPAPVIECTGGNVKLHIQKCQLEKSKYISNDLHLEDTSCLGSYDIVNNISQVFFNRPIKSGDCGGNVILNSTHLTYSNTLYITGKQKPIVSRNNVTIDFSCSFPVQLSAKLNVTLNPKLGITQITAPETNAVMTVTMAVYVNPDFTNLVDESTVLTVEQSVYVSVLIPDLDADAFSVKVVKIYAKAPTDPSDTQYTILDNGCPYKDLGYDLISIIRNGNTNEARFTMKVFQISGFSNVNLFADVTICKDNCTEDCSTKSSINDRASQSTATVSVFDLYAEEKVDSGAFDRFSMPWTLSSLLMSLLFVKLV